MALLYFNETVCLFIFLIPDVKAKAGSSPFIKFATKFPLILWHPYARHHYFCVSSEAEHKKWLAVMQDCVRNSNNGTSAVWLLLMNVVSGV